jgi:hypothetical protein
LTGSGTLADPYVIWDVNDLQNVGNGAPYRLYEYYELGQNINAAVTVAWNGGAGFDPIGKLDLTTSQWPTSDISSTGTWTVFPAIPATKFDKVDDGPINDGDATYIESGNVNESIIFGITGFTLHPDSSDLSVVMHTLAKKTAVQTCQVQRYIRISGVNYPVGPVVTITGTASYGDYYYTVPNPLPGSGGVWTIAAIQAIEGFGYTVVNDNAHFRLTDAWLYVGYDLVFNGSLDGKGFQISDLHINRPTEDYVGLFGYAQANFQNLNLVNMNITGGTSYIGTLAGRTLSCVISNINVTGIVTGPAHTDVGGLIAYAVNNTISNCLTQVIAAGDWYVAGFIAYLEGSTVHDCHAVGNVTGTGSYIGGFISEAKTCTIYDCYSIGHVVGDGVVGGFIGYIDTCTLYDCYSTGDISGVDEVGGLIGYSWITTISRCYATGNITATGDYIGGLIGIPDWSTVLQQCFATGNVSGHNRVGGLLGSPAADIDDCYSLGNVTGNNYVAGLIGYFFSGTLQNCYSTGAIAGSSNVGGLIGHNNAGVITDCFWDTGTSGQMTSDGGTGKTTEEMNHRDIYIAAGWDLDTVWNISQVTTGLSMNITPASAVLNGLLDLTIINEAYPFLRWQTVVELPCDCGFEWGETLDLGNFTPVISKNTGEAFAKAIAGLKPQTKYYFRARASSSPGPIHGGIGTFTTAIGIEVETLPATNITENSARIWGVVRKVPVTAMGRFDWGGSNEYGYETAWQPGLVSDDMFYVDLDNLAEGRAYHFRAVAMGSSLVYGNDMTFTTLSPLGPVTFIQEELAHIMEVS